MEKYFYKQFLLQIVQENDYRIACARGIYSYFANNFVYTMAPGSTPLKRDFVEYFLNTQQRGFCAHFASATTLLLREMGIPARYCEGYIIPASLVYDDAVLTEYEYNDWYQGNKAIELESVVKVPVNDSYAHAWVEYTLKDMVLFLLKQPYPLLKTNTLQDLISLISTGLVHLHQIL